MWYLVLIADVISLCLRVALLGVIAKRRLGGSYACFVAYLIFSVFTTISRLLVSHHYTLFFYIFWITEGIYAILSLLVILEVFRHVFRDFYENDTFRFVLLGCLAIIILGLLLTVPAGHHADAPPVTSVILSANLGLRMLQVSVLVLFLSLVVFLDLARWRYDLGIVLGYGLFAAVHLIALSLWSQLGVYYGGWIVSLGHPLAYDCAAGIWLLAFSRAQRLLPPEEYTGRNSAEKLARHLGYFTDAHRRLSSRRWLG